jgi:hydrogenase expression/formation protein HypC
VAHLAQRPLTDTQTIMCLAVPGKLIDIFTQASLKMGRFDFNGTITSACLEYVPEISIGQYGVIHAGFAISILDEEEAQQSFEAWQELREKMGDE